MRFDFLNSVDRDSFDFSGLLGSAAPMRTVYGYAPGGDAAPPVDFGLAQHTDVCCTCGDIHDYVEMKSAGAATDAARAASNTDKPIFADDIPDNTSTTVTLTIGGSLAGTVDTESDRDWYRVELVAGQRYTFTLSSSGSPALQDPLLRLRDASGAQLVENDDFGGTLNSRISFTATSSGTYFLDAGSFSNATQPAGTGGYVVSAVTSAPLTERSIDGIANFLTSEYWSPRRWTPGSNITFNVESLSAGAQILAEQALTAWAEVTGLSFTRVAFGGQITFGNTQSGAFASSTLSGTDAQGFRIITAANINVNSNWNGGNLNLDSYTYQTYLHEVGHAIGLGHGGPYNGSATYGLDNSYLNDTWSYTVMSYFDQLETGYGSYRFVLGPQQADIVAVQNLYGADPAGTRSGDTVYGFNSTETDINNWAQFTLTQAEGTYRRPPAYAIYDTGGTDTIDLSGFASQQVLNLNPETFSSLGFRPLASQPNYRNVISISSGTIIENAIGGSGDDIFTGNSANNLITLGAGADTYIYLANGGADAITDFSIALDRIDTGALSQTAVETAFANRTDSGGGALLNFGSGQTVTLLGISAAQLTDLNLVFPVTGTPGNDFLTGTSRFENISALAGDDIVTGSGGDDRVNGGDGADTIYGDNGNDLLNGDAGIDILIGGFGVDTLNGGNDADYLYGDDGNDTLRGDAGNDVLVAGVGDDTLVAGDGFDYLYAGDGNDTLSAASGLNVFIGEAGNDTMTGGTGRDYFYGGIGNDTMNGGADIDILIGEDGIDSMNGESGNDYIYAGTGNDFLNGGDGVDFMLGEDGIDTLNGGRDVNYLYGGAGSDTFIQNHTTGAGVDVISDFEYGTDRIRLVAGTVTSFAAVQSNMTYNALGFTVIQTGASTSIWLAGDVRSTITAASFEFVPQAEAPDDTDKADIMEDLFVSDPESGLPYTADWMWVDGVAAIGWA